MINYYNYGDVYKAILFNFYKVEEILNILKLFQIIKSLGNH